MRDIIKVISKILMSGIIKGHEIQNGLKLVKVDGEKKKGLCSVEEKEESVVRLSTVNISYIGIIMYRHNNHLHFSLLPMLL